MPTLKQLHDGTKILLDHGIEPEHVPDFHHGAVAAGFTDAPSRELIRAMVEAGWAYNRINMCFVLGPM